MTKPFRRDNSLYDHREGRPRDRYDASVSQSSMWPGRVYVMVYHQTLLPDDAEELARAILEHAATARATLEAVEKAKT